MIKNLRKNWLLIICVAVLVSILLPIYIGAFYAVPASDDFSYASKYVLYDTNILKFLLLNVRDYYMTWQGGFSAIFLSGFPTYFFFGTAGLTVEIVICSTLFFVALAWFIKMCLYKMGASDIRKFTLVLYTMILFYVLCVNGLSEIFYWHTGVAEYMMTTTCSFLSAIMYMKYDESSKKNVCLVLGCIFAVIGAGALLNISAFLCTILMFLVAYDIFVQKKINKSCSIFIVAVLFSVVNAVAPGNFARHTFFDSEVRVGEMLFQTMLKINQVISTDIRSGLFLFAAVVSFVYGINRFKESEFDFKLPGLVTLYCYFSMIISDFPIVLGYSGTNFPIRCDFTEKLTVILFIVFAATYWGGWCAQKCDLSFTKEHLIIIGIVCAIPLSAYLNFTTLMEFTPYKMVKHISNGDFKRVSERQKSLIEQVKTSEDADVVVVIPAPEEGEWVNIMTTGAGDNAENYINASMAAIYGKNSVVVLQE